MKLNATIKNERGGKKSVCDDAHLFIELTYGNKIIGNIGFYTIFTGHGTKAIGHRVVWKDENTPVMGNVLRDDTLYSLVKGKR